MLLRPAWYSLRPRAGLSQRFSTGLPHRRPASIPVPTHSVRTPKTPPAYETIEQCPSPTCACQPMPAGLDIDHKSKMVMPFYDRHVVITSSSAAADWPSRVEDEPGSLPGKLKQMLGPKGEFYRPDFAVSVHTSTLPRQAPASMSVGSQVQTSQEGVYLFPDFCHLTLNTSPNSSPSLPGLFSLSDFTRLINDERPLSASADTAGRSQIQPINVPVVLICGHGQRDERCGILGPLLEREFERCLRTAGFRIEGAAAGKQVERGEASAVTEEDESTDAAYLGLISHTGGHKFAGNVIVYLPPRTGSPLAGKGVWYGRVEPKHVEGIVHETLRCGRVIRELLRGVHDFGKP